MNDKPPSGQRLLLLALHRVGGQAPSAAVVRAATELDPSTDPKRIRERVASALSNAVKAGLVVRDSEAGTYSMTDAGRASLASPPTRLRRRPQLLASFIDNPAPPPPGRVGSGYVGHLLDGELVSLYGEVLAEARRREILKTGGFIGEWAEVLVEHALRGSRPGPSEKGWDVFVPDTAGPSTDSSGVAGRRVQVKARHVWDPARDGQFELGSISTRGPEMASSFEDLAIVLFNEQMGVQLGVLIDVKTLAAIHGTQAAIIARDSIVYHPAARDITATLRQVAAELGARRPDLSVRDWNEAARRVVPTLPDGSRVTALGFPHPDADDPEERQTYRGVLVWSQNPYTHTWDAYVETAHGTSQIDARTLVVDTLPGQ